MEGNMAGYSTSQATGVTQFVVLPSMELKNFQDNNRKSEMTARWRKYFCNILKICDIVGPKTQNKLSGSQYPVAKFL